jgi:hypothetical protein
MILYTTKVGSPKYTPNTIHNTRPTTKLETIMRTTSPSCSEGYFINECSDVFPNTDLNT